MTSRFRFLDREGQEVQIPSLEALTRLFESGTLDRDTLLFDALTGEWGPAHANPVCQLIFEELGLEQGSAVGSTEPDAGGETGQSGTGTGSSGESDLGELELTPEDEPGSDRVQAFLEARDRERREEELRGASRTGEVTLVNPGQDSLSTPTRADFRGVADPAAETRWPEPTGSPSRSPGREAPSGDPPAPLPTRAAPVGRSRTGSSRADSPYAPPRRSLSRRQEPRRFILFSLLLVVGAVGIADAWSSPMEHAPEILDEPDRPRVTAPPLSTGPLTPSEEDIRDAAFEEMVAGMDALRERLRVGEPPAAWMSGPYLAEAGQFPDVASYWIRYGSFVDTLRVREQDLFLAGFRDRMRELGIQGSVLTVREARALQDFRTGADRRNTQYDAMEELSEAAVDLHRFLVENTDAIDYTPVDQGVAQDPVLEITIRRNPVRTELWGRLDRLLEALDVVVGPDPDRRRDVTQRILGTLVGEDRPPEP